MTMKLALLIMCLMHLTRALPTNLLSTLGVETLQTIDAMEDIEDNVSVGSYIREVRSAPSNEGSHYKTDEREADGEIGYSRKKSGGGKKGYQHFDSYHKKAGDHFEFEKQDSFGHDKEEQDGAYSHRNERRAEREDESDPGEYEDAERKDRGRKKSKNTEKQHAELREGADDGNGGVEAYGHDPNDYILPEKYTYGNEADEYNF